MHGIAKVLNLGFNRKHTVIINADIHTVIAWLIKKTLPYLDQVSFYSDNVFESVRRRE